MTDIFIYSVVYQNFEIRLCWLCINGRASLVLLNHLKSGFEFLDKLRHTIMVVKPDKTVELIRFWAWMILPNKMSDRQRLLQTYFWDQLYSQFKARISSKWFQRSVWRFQSFFMLMKKPMVPWRVSDIPPMLLSSKHGFNVWAALTRFHDWSSKEKTL